MPRLRHLWALAVVLLVAAACGDDSADDTTATDAPVTSDAPVATDAPSDDDDPADDDAPPGLTATDDGVTATTIKIGAVFPDLSVIGRDSGDVEAKFQIAVDAVNDAGGINGRDLELVFSLYSRSATPSPRSSACA